MFEGGAADFQPVADAAAAEAAGLAAWRTEWGFGVVRFRHASGGAWNCGTVANIDAQGRPLALQWAGPARAPPREVIDLDFAS